MPQFVVMGLDRLGGRRPTLHASLEDAKDAVRAYMYDETREPVAPIEDLALMERDLLGLNGTCVERVTGHSDLDECLYVAPLDP